MGRYNRVEGLSLGTSGNLPLRSRFSVRAEARIGTADWEPRGELTLYRGELDEDGRCPATDDSTTVPTGRGHSSSLGPLRTYWEVTITVPSSTRQRRAQPGVVGACVPQNGAPLLRGAPGSVQGHGLLFPTGLGSDDNMPENITAVEGSVYGGDVELRGHRGVRPRRAHAVRPGRPGGRGRRSRVLALAGQRNGVPSVGLRPGRGPRGRPGYGGRGRPDPTSLLSRGGRRRFAASTRES